MPIEWETLKEQDLQIITDLTNRVQTLEQMIKELDEDLAAYAGKIRNTQLTYQSEITVISNQLTHIRRPTVT